MGSRQAYVICQLIGTCPSAFRSLWEMGRHSNKRQKQMVNPVAFNPLAMMMNPMAASMMMNPMRNHQSHPESSESESEPAGAKAAPPAPAPAPVTAAPANEEALVTHGVPGVNDGPVQDAELDSVITRSASLLKGLPRRWLSEIMERLDSSFDATLTANLSVLGLLACLYLFTRMRPSMQVSVLRVLVAY